MSDDDAKEWRWVGEDGVEKKTSEQELIAELSSESLPHYVLVWKKGWSEWLPAMQVAELSWTLPPGKADESVKPKEKPGAESPPAPPLYRYPVIKRRAANLNTDKSGSLRPPAPPRPPALPRPPAPPRPPGASAPPRKADIEPPTLEAPTQALGLPAEPPTVSAPPPLPRAAADEAEAVEVEPEPVEISEELHSQDEVEEVDAVLEESQPDHAPPDLGGFAVAEPPAAGPQVYTEEVDDAETRLMPSKPPPPDESMGNEAQYVAPHAPPRPSSAPYDDSADLPRIPPPPPQPKGFEQYARGAERRLTQPPYLIGAAAAGLVLIAIIIFAASGSDEDEEIATGKTAASAVPPTEKSAARAPAPKREPEPEPKLAEPCSFNREAVALEDTAYVGIQAAFVRVPDSSRVAVGFAATRTEARGITIDPKSLDHDQIYRKTGRAPLESVVPAAASGKLGFQITRNVRDELASAVAVDHAPPFVVGLDDEGQVALEKSGSEQRSVLWPLEAETITTPSIAAVDDTRYAVALREGGTAGKVRAGFFTEKGKAEGPLSAITTEEAFVGTPSMAANEEGVVVAFAARASAEDSWTVKLAAARHPTAPEKAQTFRLPEGGPGENAISPRAIGLDEGRWLVQWTEGKSGNRVVRVQVLDDELSPLSEPLRISPESKNAGQGALWVDGDTVVTLFFVQGKRGHELWGASLSCPRN